MHLWGAFAVTKKPLSSGFFVASGFDDFEFVVAGEVHDEIPGHGLVGAQCGVHHHALNAADRHGHAPRGITQVASGLRAARAKAAHDTGKALGPVAGPKGPALAGDALDEDFLGRTGCHRWIRG